MSRINGKKTNTHYIDLFGFVWCPCMAIIVVVSVQYDGGLLPDIIEFSHNKLMSKIQPVVTR